MGARLISLFGTGDYEAVRYELGGVTTERETALLPWALVELLPRQTPPIQVTSVIIVGTKEAQSNYRGTYAIEAAIQERAFRGQFVFDLIHHGGQPGEQRQVFETLVHWMSPGAIVDSLRRFREAEPPTQILLDVTHGFRAQALIAGAAVPFVFAEAVRRGDKNLPPIRVFYGRHEPGEGMQRRDYVAPVWELTEFVSTTLWTLAIQAAGFGRGNAAEILAKQEVAQGEAGAGTTSTESLWYPAKLGKALREYADALAYLRVPEILRSRAPQLHALLQSPERRKLVERMRVLGPLLDELERDVASVTSRSGKVLDQAGLEAMANLARLYGRLERFAEQAATVREAYITQFGLNHTRPEPALEPFIEPGTDGASADRQAIENAIPEHGGPPRPGSRTYAGNAPGELLANLNRARDLRNDVLHCGIRDNDTTGALSLRLRFEQLADDLAAKCSSAGGRLDVEHD